MKESAEQLTQLVLDNPITTKAAATTSIGGAASYIFQILPDVFSFLAIVSGVAASALLAYRHYHTTRIALAQEERDEEMHQLEIEKIRASIDEIRSEKE